MKLYLDDGVHGGQVCVELFRRSSSYDWGLTLAAPFFYSGLPMCVGIFSG